MGNKWFDTQNYNLRSFLDGENICIEIFCDPFENWFMICKQVNLELEKSLSDCKTRDQAKDAAIRIVGERLVDMVLEIGKIADARKKEKEKDEQKQALKQALQKKLKK